MSKAEERFADLTNRYLIGAGIAGIFVVGRADADDVTDVRLMIATDLVSAVADIERDPGAVVLHRAWFSNAGVAARVFKRVEMHGKPSRAARIADHLIRWVMIEADDLGVDIKTDRDVTGQCVAAVQEIEREIDAARVDGRLRDVNAAFKAHREGSGAAAMSYEDWLHQYKIKVVEGAAARLRSALRQSTM